MYSAVATYTPVVGLNIYRQPEVPTIFCDLHGVLDLYFYALNVQVSFSRL